MFELLPDERLDYLLGQEGKSFKVHPSSRIHSTRHCSHDLRGSRFNRGGLPISAQETVQFHSFYPTGRKGRSRVLKSSRD